jgi:hypothetical protein
MFDVTPEDIASLDDEILRELVGRLAAAELVRFGQSPLAVTWGGSQTAADGGVDVRIDLPPGAIAGANIPRSAVGYQVKKSDMPRGAILGEMKPGTNAQSKGALRPAIAALAAVNGAYIIVSANGATADGRLEERRLAMRDALSDCPDADRLHTDFYDRTRIATWVREHPGLVLWTREKAGRAIAGWLPYGNWSNPTEAPDARYLIDDRLRIRMDGQDGDGVTVQDAIIRLRQALAQSRASVRLVGLSGVGKTRLVQALFDPRVGTDALPPAAAVYTDFHENTVPQPEGMAANLQAQRRHAILIIDNCGADTHERLTKQCQQSGSLISLLTVEYDVRENLLEETEVVTIDTASPSLVEDLLLRRYHDLSRENAHTIAEASGGNARIALAIAHTVKKADSLAGLRSAELFGRLFRQRHDNSDALLRAAEACALVYSFNSEVAAGELIPLAQMAGMDVTELYRHVQELRERQLVQRRSTWRAVLPHALANYLASKALDRIPSEMIRSLLVDSDQPRLLRSFAHRLSYLHGHAAAVAWCREWLEPGGVLGCVEQYDYEQHLMFSDIAPVVPENALAAIERAAATDLGGTFERLHATTEIIRLIAWDPDLFGRCVALLVRIVRANRHRIEHEAARKILVSFCQPNRSGTHAPVAQRFALIASWLDDPDIPVQHLGRMALEHALSTKISSTHGFNFGARKRDNGYLPATAQEFFDWFQLGLDLLQRHAQPGAPHDQFAHETLAKHLPALWAYPLLHDALEAHLNSYAQGQFWRDGWLAVRIAIRNCEHRDEDCSRLRILEVRLAPTDLTGRVLAAVLPANGAFISQAPGEDYVRFQDRLEQAILTLGREAALDLSTLLELAPRLLTCGGATDVFGIGLAQAAGTRKQVWEVLVQELAALAPPRLRPQLLRGFIMELARLDRPHAEQCLEQCAANSGLVHALPALQAAAGFDAHGLQRMRRAYDDGHIPVAEFFYLRAGANAAPEVQFAILELLTKVAGEAGGMLVVIDALQSWMHEAVLSGTSSNAHLTHICQRVLALLEFSPINAELAYGIMQIARASLHGPNAAALAASLAIRMRVASEVYTLAQDYDELTWVLLQREPEAVLTALCHGDADVRSAGVDLLWHERRTGGYPVGQVDQGLLVTWCATDEALRLPFALGVIPVVETDAATGAARLTGQARVLLENASAPKDALRQLLERIEDQSWRHSKAAVMEHNAGALDEVMGMFDTDFQAFAREAKACLLAKAAERTIVETERDRTRNERFER